MKKALVFWGGWEGHDPEKVSLRLQKFLEKNGFEVERVEGVDCLKDAEKLLSYDLIVPCVTMGELPTEYAKNVSEAISSGVGIAGCHGGMCDAFRTASEWQFITGGQFVAHPGGCVNYKVDIRKGTSPIIEGIDSFEVTSEQYYLLVDPAIEVLASTRFPVAQGNHSVNKPIDMPVVWTKYWGKGRVFYCSLGHNDGEFEKLPQLCLLMERGMLWAADGKN